MALEIVLGGSGSGKTYKVYEQIVKASINNPSENYYLIVPDQFTMETQRDIINRHPHKGTMNIDIVSFNRLAYRVFGELGINRLSVLDDTGKMLILRKVIEENKNELTIFKNKVKLFGFTEEIKSTISELYQYGINIDDIDDICSKISGNNTMKSKLSDIRLIFKKFEEYITNISTEDSKYITKEEVLSELCDVIDDSVLLKNSTIVIDGFTGFTPIQYKLIKHLLLLAKKVVVIVTMSGKEACCVSREGFVEIKEHELFNMSKTTVNMLIRLAAESNVEVLNPVVINNEDVYRLKDNRELSYLEKNIFRSGKDKCTVSSDNIQIFNADNVLLEARGVSDIIVSMVRESKGEIRYRDIAIVTGDMEGYKRPLEEALSGNDIPFYIDNKKSLLNNNFVDCIRALLELIDENFAYEPVFRYLKRGMSNISVEDIDLFENYVLGCGIRGFKQYNHYFTKKYRGLTDEQLNKCEEIRVAFIEPISKFKESIEGQNVSNITKAIYKFIKDNDLYVRLEAYTNEFSDEESEKQEYSQVYRLIMELFDKLVSLLGDEKISLKEYRKILDDGLEEIKVGTIPVVLDQLVVGDIERTRTNNIKVLIVMGVNEGIIPKSSGNNGVFSQRDRMVLKNISVEMSPTARENGFIQKFYLYLNLTKPSKKLVLTYSDANLRGDAKKPSYLVGTIVKMFDGINVENIGNNQDEYDICRVNSKENAFKLVTRGLRKNDIELISNVWKELYSLYLKNPEYKDRIERALEGAFFVNTDVRLQSAIAKAIFGENVEGSITRIEKYAECAYEHFLMYGLNLVPRPVYEIKSVDIGNIYHKAVESFSNKLKTEGIDFKNVSDSERERLVEASVKEAIIYYGYDNISDSPKNKYILEKVKKITDRSAWAICEHIKKGRFTPDQFEVSVGKGRVDRIDKLEIGDNVYIKIIDYKSPGTVFDTDKLINGLQLQLIYYMDAVLENEKRKCPDKNIAPGGVFYFNIKDPIIDYDKKFMEDDGLAYEKMLKEYQMSGIFNSAAEVLFSLDETLPELSGKKTSSVVQASKSEADVDDTVKKNAMGLSAENFAKVTKFVRGKAKEYTKDIYDGNIVMNPYKNGDKTSCTYCNYNSICVFSKGEFNNFYRKLKKYEKEGEAK